MRDAQPFFGVADDGTFLPVHATAAPEYGRGALIGLAASADAPIVSALAEVVASLMTCGMVEPADIARRWQALGTSAPLLLVAVPVGLFHAGQSDELMDGVLAVGAMLRCDESELLGAVAVACAISAGTYDMGHANDMTIAAVDALDSASLRLGESAAVAAAREALREDLRVAVDDVAPHDGRVRVAFWHLLHDGDARNVALDPLAGALLGAAHGAEALPPELHARAASLTTLIAD